MTRRKPNGDVAGAAPPDGVTRLRALLAVLRASSTELEERPLLRHAAQGLLDHVPCDVAELRLARRSGAPAFRAGPAEAAADLEWMHDDATASATLVTLDEAASATASSAYHFAVCVPIVAYERVLGTLLLARDAAFEADDLQLLQTVGAHLGIALEHARILRRSTLDAEQLERASAQHDVDLSEKNAQLARTRWLAALGQMAAGVAHDLNNALNPIVAFAGLIEQHADEPELVRRYAERILLAARDGAKTVQRIQVVTRKRRGIAPTRAEVVSLARVVQEAVDLARSTWSERKGGQCEVEQHVPESLLAWANAAELREALLNVIGNALDAMPTGGVIRFVATRDGEEILLGVQDTGTGMSEDVRRRALEPFFTTKGMRGTGLGLSEVYGILRRQGGSVEIESWPGLGTTVLVRLPAADEPLTAQPARRKRRRPSRPQRLLVVDDNLLSAEATAAALRSAGHEVTIAGTAEEALERFAPGAFDVVLSDLGLPGMSGWDLIDQLRARDSAARFGVITGWAIERGDDELRRRKVDLVFLKPVDPDELLAAL